MSNLDEEKCSDQTGISDGQVNPSIDLKPDAEWITLARERYEEDKLFEAYRMLKNVQDKSLFGEQEEMICSMAIECESAIADLLEEPDMRHGWTKQGECHGEYDTTIFYKVDPATAHLTCRLETPIESSLLIPLLSVLNESNLYTDWCPSWTRPIAVGITTSEQIQRIGRVNQMIHVVGKIPWPFYPREVYLETTALDDIDDNNYFAVRLSSKSPGGMVPEPEPSVERVDFQGVLLFRPCPIDRTNTAKNYKDGNSDGRPSMILVSFKMFCDAKISGIPVQIINFITRTVIGEIWGQLLHVAKQVQLGQRQRHQTAIDNQPALNGFIQERVRTMLDQISSEFEKSENLRFISYLQS